MLRIHVHQLRNKDGNLCVTLTYAETVAHYFNINSFGVKDVHVRPRTYMYILWQVLEKCQGLTCTSTSFWIFFWIMPQDVHVQPKQIDREGNHLHNCTVLSLWRTLHCRNKDLLSKWQPPVNVWNMLATCSFCKNDKQPNTGQYFQKKRLQQALFLSVECTKDIIRTNVQQIWWVQRMYIFLLQNFKELQKIQNVWHFRVFFKPSTERVTCKQAQTPF